MAKNDKRKDEMPWNNSHFSKLYISVQELCVEYGGYVNTSCVRAWYAAVGLTHYTHFNSDMELFLRMFVNMNAFYSYVEWREEDKIFNSSSPSSPLARPPHISSKLSKFLLHSTRAKR